MVPKLVEVETANQSVATAADVSNFNCRVEANLTLDTEVVLVVLLQLKIGINCKDGVKEVLARCRIPVTETHRYGNRSYRWKYSKRDIVGPQV